MMCSGPRCGIIDGHARVLFVGDSVKGLVERDSPGREKMSGRGHHDLADEDVFEVEGALDDLLLRGLQQPMRRLAETMSFSSSGECTPPSRTWRAPKALRTSATRSVMTAKSGAARVMKTSMGPATASATASVRCRAIGFGNDLTQDHVHVGDQDESEHDAESVGVERGSGASGRTAAPVRGPWRIRRSSPGPGWRG